MSKSAFSEPQPENVAEILFEATKKARGVHDFFGWHEKSIKELGIARETLEVAKISYSELQSAQSDPPDCVARIDGMQVGIEVTELVDEAHIRRVKAGGNPYDWTAWPEDRFTQFLTARIAAKDKRDNIKNGPYERYFLILHTDEPLLPRELVRRHLENYEARTDLIDEIFLLLSYDTETKSCTVFRVKVNKPVVHDL